MQTATANMLEVAYAASALLTRLESYDFGAVSRHELTPIEREGAEALEKAGLVVIRKTSLRHYSVIETSKCHLWQD